MGIPIMWDDIYTELGRWPRNDPGERQHNMNTHANGDVALLRAGVTYIVLAIP